MPVKVVDASAFGALVFSEPKAEQVAEVLADNPLAAPSLLWYELSSICLKKLALHPELEEALLNAFDLGRWIHLAVVYNSQEKRVTHYLNGRVVGQMSKQEMPPLNIGQAQIGNWMTFRPNDPSAIRNFNGRIDELAVFSEPLNTSEIEEIYEIGKPR